MASPAPCYSDIQHEIVLWIPIKILNACFKERPAGFDHCRQLCTIEGMKNPVERIQQRSDISDMRSPRIGEMSQMVIAGGNMA